MLKKIFKKFTKAPKVPVATNEGANCLNVDRLMMESLPLCIKMFDSKANLLFINKHGREEHSLEGWTDPQIRKWDYLQCIAPQSRPHVRQAMRDALLGKSSHFTIEHSNTHAHGGFCSSSIVPIKVNGEIQYILFSSQDITDQKKMGETLTASEEKLRILFKNTSDGILQTDPQGKIVMLNEAFAKMHGYTVGEMLKMSLPNLDAPETAKLAPERMKRVLAGERMNFNVEHFRKDGQTIHLEVSASLAFIDNRKYVIGFHRDITERMKADLALKESEEKFRLLFNSTDDGIVQIGPNGKILMLNDAFAKMHGYTVGEILKMNIQDLDTPETAKLAPGRLKRILRGENLNFNVTHFRRDGTTFPVEVSASMISINGQNYVFAIDRDVTERSKAENELKKSEKRYHDIFEGSQDALMLLNGTGFFDCNHATLRMFGYKTVKEFCTRHPGQVSPPTQPDGTPSLKLANQRIAEAFKKGSNLFEWVHRRKNGNDFIASVLLVPFELEGRKVLQATVRDISEQKKAEEELKKMTLRQKSILGAVPDILMEVDKSKTYTWANQAGLEFFGRDAVGKKASDYFEGEQKTLKTVKPVFAGKEETIYVESWQRRKDGQKRLLAWWCRSLKDKNGKVIGALSSGRDITDQKKAEEALRENERSLQQAQHLAHVGSWHWTLATDTITWSEELYRIRGIDPKLPTPRFSKLSRYYTPESWKRVNKAIASNLRTGKTYELDLDIVRPDGTLRNTVARGEAEFDAKGKIASLRGTLQDITERKRAEQEIADWARIPQENPRPIIRISDKARILYLNPSSNGLLKGWKPKIGEKLNPILLKAILPHIRSKTQVELEITLNKTIFSCLVVPVPEREYLNLYFLDITEQKKIEQTKMDLISMASHQLRTPPTGIKWFATMLLDEDVGEINPKQRSYLKEILFNNQKMIDLVHSLLNVSRIELGTLFVNTKLQKFQAPAVVDDILEELNSQIQEKELIILKSYERSLPALQADPALLRIVLHNLIHNAILYTEDGGKITLGVKRGKSEILMTVSDTGLGIPKAQQPKLFSKFFRADNVIGGKAQGTGLGLYIAKTLTIEMGGTLKFKSVPGKGSTFFLAIPIKSEIPSMIPRSD